MSALGTDLRLAARNLSRRPGFAATAILTLALGVGANSLVFTWAKALVLRPLPGVARAGEIVMVSGTLGDRQSLSHAPEDLDFYRAGLAAKSQAGSGSNSPRQALVDLAGFEFAEISLGVAERPEMIGGGVVSGNYFDLLGVNAASGRLLSEADDRAGAEAVAVLSESMARRLFGSTAAAIGRSVRVQRRDLPVVGVAAAPFVGTYGGLAQQIFVSRSSWTELSGKPLQHQMLGRLAPGATRADAQAELDRLVADYIASDPSQKGWSVAVHPAHESQRGFTGGLAPLVGVLLVVVALVLAVACANLASLFLARAVDRQRETSIRLALGAERADLLRQQLAESVLLAFAGAAAGLLPALLLADSIFRLLPLEGMSFGVDLSLDAPVVLATLAVALAAALVSSLAPVFGAGRVSAAQSMHSESAGAIGGRKRTRLRAGLVAVQLALSLAAIAGAAILVRATARDLAADPGFARDGGLVASINLRAGGYDAERGQAFLEQAILRLGALPGATGATVSSFLPMGTSGGGNGRGIEIEGFVPPDTEPLGVVSDSVGPDYFAVVGIPVRRGRDFAAGDRAGAPPVAIVTEAFERRFLPNGALGGRIKVGGEWREIVGIAADATYRSIRETRQPHLYVPVAQLFEPRMTFLVRTAGDPAALAAPLRDALAKLDSDLPVTAIETLATHTASGLFAGKIAALLISALGTLALVLAAIGLYGLLSYSVAARRRELGVRSALGASAREIVALVCADGLRLLAIGGAVGLALAAGLGSLLKSEFPGAEAFDPIALTASLLVLTLVAAAATASPAARAARVEPASVLREE